MLKVGSELRQFDHTFMIAAHGCGPAAGGTPSCGDRASRHSASRTAMRIAPGICGACVVAVAAAVALPPSAFLVGICRGYLNSLLSAT